MTTDSQPAHNIFFAARHVRLAVGAPTRIEAAAGGRESAVLYCLDTIFMANSAPFLKASCPTAMYFFSALLTAALILSSEVAFWLASSSSSFVIFSCASRAAVSASP